MTTLLFILGGILLCVLTLVVGAGIVVFGALLIRKLTKLMFDVSLFFPDEE